MLVPGGYKHQVSGCIWWKRSMSAGPSRTLKGKGHLIPIDRFRIQGVGFSIIVPSMTSLKALLLGGGAFGGVALDSQQGVWGVVTSSLLPLRPRPEKMTVMTIKHSKTSWRRFHMNMSRKRRWPSMLYFFLGFHCHQLSGVPNIAVSKMGPLSFTDFGGKNLGNLSHNLVTGLKFQNHDEEFQKRQ